MDDHALRSKGLSHELSIIHQTRCSIDDQYFTRASCKCGWEFSYRAATRKASEAAVKIAWALHE